MTHTETAPVGRLRRVLAGTALALVLCIAGPVAGASAAAPANDDFANAVSIPFPPADPGTASATGTTAEATAQAGEPNPAGAADNCNTTSDGPNCTSSVWYSFTPDRDGLVALRTCELSGADDTVIGVYTGTGVDTLTEVASNDDSSLSSCGTFSSRVDFNAHAGTTYYVDVAGFHANSTGFTLHLSSPPTPDKPEVRANFGNRVNPDRIPLTFDIQGNDGVTFSCAVDGGAAQPCSPTFTASGAGMEDGTTHTLTATATEGDRTSDPSDPVTWTIDKVAPETSITSGPADGDSVGPSPSWVVQSSEDGRIGCTIDGAEVGFAGCTNISANTDRTVSAHDLCNSSHALGFDAMDIAGNPDPTPETRTVTVSGGGACAAPTFGTFYSYAYPTAVQASSDVDGHGAGTIGHLEWGTTTAYGNTTPDESVGIGGSLGNNGLDDVMIFLEPETTYHVRFVATNPTDTTTSEDHEVTTPAATGDAPEPSLRDPSAITDTSATLNAHLHSTQSAYVRFEYGTTPAYGQTTELQYADTANQDFSAPLTGLQPGTTYHYRFATSSDGGTARTADATFTTTSNGQPGATTTPPPPVTLQSLRDVLAPGIHAAGANRAHFGRKFVWAWVTSSEDATGTATGTMSVPGAAVVVRLPKATVKLHRGKRSKIKLRIHSADASRLKRYLHGHRALVKITIAATDASGNRTTKRLSYRLAR